MKARVDWWRPPSRRGDTEAIVLLFVLIGAAVCGVMVGFVVVFERIAHIEAHLVLPKG
jgi:hypothetical protein